MGTRFSIEQQLSGPPELVLAAMADASWYDAVRATPTDWAPTLEDVAHVDGLVVATVRYRFRGELNRAARAVLDADRLAHVDRVTIHPDGTFTWDVEPEQMAGTLAVTARGRVAAAAHGATRSLTGEVTVRYPLLGGKVERAIVDGLGSHGRHEERAFPAWMAERDRPGRTEVRRPVDPSGREA